MAVSTTVKPDRSVLVTWTDAGPVTLLRNGVVLASGLTGSVYYDHYPPASATYAIGASSSTVAVLEDAQRRTWLKGIDPNLAVAVMAGNEARDRSRPQSAARRKLTTGETWTSYAPRDGWHGTVAVVCLDKATRDKVWRLLDAQTDVYVDWSPGIGLEPMWVQIGDGAERIVGRADGTAAWLLNLPAEQVSAPSDPLMGLILPGWSWDAWEASGATWDAPGYATWAAAERGPL